MALLSSRRGSSRAVANGFFTRRDPVQSQPLVADLHIRHVRSIRVPEIARFVSPFLRLLQKAGNDPLRSGHRLIARALCYLVTSSTVPPFAFGTAAISTVAIVIGLCR